MTTGIVEFLDDPNQYGFFSMKVGGVKYGLGKKAPAVSKGDTVEFDSYLKDGKYNTVRGDVRKVETATAPAALGTTAGKPASAPYVNPKDSYWADKDRYDKEVKEPRITFLAAYERAVQFVDLALRNGAISLEKVKGPDKLGVIEAAVAERTQQIIDASAGTAKQKAVEEPAGTTGEPDDGQWS